jgi:hypothetical protein
MRTVSWRRKSQSATVLLAAVMIASGHTQSHDITLQLPPHQQWRAERYRDAATRAVEFFASWLGPSAPGAVVIQAVPWSAPVTYASTGPLPVRDRWFALDGDRSFEHFVIAGLARRYWLDATTFPQEEQWLAGGLARYTAVRAALEIVERDHYASPSFFGGMFTFPVRYAPLTSDWWEGRPPPATFAEAEDVLSDLDAAQSGRARRAGRALQTLERILGRPALDSAIAEFARRGRGREVTVEEFTSCVENVTGRNLSWFFTGAFDEQARYDYGVGELDTGVMPDARYVSRVVLRRLGNAVFSGTSEPPVGTFEEGRGIEWLATFADGSEVRDHWDGRTESRIFEFTSRAPLAAVTVDPEAVLLLDEQWGNNKRTLSPLDHSATLQWSLLWMAWLQGFMLSMTAFV